jgi:hypothetical protein
MYSHSHQAIDIDGAEGATNDSSYLPDQVEQVEQILSKRILRQPDSYSRPRFARSEIRKLLNKYLSFSQLDARLYDLPIQFKQPRMRPWQVIEWRSIETTQIVGISPAVFLAAIAGCINIEAPIHDYSSTSWYYLQQLYPDMAKFVGGVRSADGSLIEMGLWEKEERQHAPVLRRLYQQLAGSAPQRIKLRAKEYQPSSDPHQDLFRHGLHRITTEYGATCLYLWLMMHSTGALRNLLEELLRDEVNHMTKFLGFGLWAFPGSDLALKPSYFKTLAILLWQKLRSSFSHFIKHVFGNLCSRWRREQVRSPQVLPKPSKPAKYSPAIDNLYTTFKHVMGLVSWQIWTWQNKLELILVFVIVLWRLRCWSNHLTDMHLQDLFGVPPLANSSSPGRGS